MEDPAKRYLLKTGLFLFSSAACPTFSSAQPAQRPTLFQILNKHRWLTSDASIQQKKGYVPPIIEKITGAIRSPLVFWVETNLALIRKYRINPLRAARTLSYLMTALHDTVLSSSEKYGNSPAHVAVAIHLVAGNVLEHLFPEEIKGRWIGEGIMSASRHVSERTSADWADMWNLSSDIARRAVVHALTDGSARINALAQPPKAIALPWKAAPPLWSTRPAEPGAASWRPWLVHPSIGEQCPPPLTLEDTRYSDAIQEVYHTHQNLTPEQKKIAEDWNLELGTVTPPGVWLLKAAENPAFMKLTLIEQTGLLSLLTVSMMDAFTACWHVKFKWWTERPITAIRRLYNPDFLPHILTPSFPSYTSGHATVSGAAAFILSNLLPQHKDEWNTAAQDAANSRLYGGIHFRFDNEEGLLLGKKVAQLAVAKLATNS